MGIFHWLVHLLLHPTEMGNSNIDPSRYRTYDLDPVYPTSHPRLQYINNAASILGSTIAVSGKTAFNIATWLPSLLIFSCTEIWCSYNEPSTVKKSSTQEAICHGTASMIVGSVLCFGGTFLLGPIGSVAGMAITAALAEDDRKNK